MSMAHSQKEIKGKSLVELAEQLEASIREAAQAEKSLYEVERDTFEYALRIGYAAIEQLLMLQGDGDLGERVITADGRCLERSEKPAERPLRTVFGEHTIRAYVYAAGSHEAIELRPVDARLSLSAGCPSYFFEEFSQYFCVDQAFGQASQGLATVLHQEVSVNTLEHINRRMGGQAEGFLDELPTPPAKEEGELLVFTADGKGVPLVKEDAERVPAFDKVERPGNRRMATLAAVYTINPYVRTPEQIVAALFRDDKGPRPKDRPQPQFKHVTARFTSMREDPDGERLEQSRYCSRCVGPDVHQCMQCGLAQVIDIQSLDEGRHSLFCRLAAVAEEFRRANARTEVPALECFDQNPQRGVSLEQLARVAAGPAVVF